MVKTTTLGGTAKEIVVAKVAHGLMTMTVGKEAISDEQAFESIRGGVDALPPGAKMLLNSAEFYDNERGTSNLELLARFYERYPGYAEKTFLSVKGGITEGHQLSCKRNVLRNSVDRCIAALRGTKQIDLFQPARIDRDVTIEDTMRTLAELVREEKFKHIGLTECRAETIRRGHAIHPIAIVEIEISPLVYEEETKRVIAVCAELDIAIAAYSPLAHGVTSGGVKQPQDVPNVFQAMTRLKGETWEYTRRFKDAFVELAGQKGCTPAQLSIAWVGTLGEKVIPMPGSSRKDRTLENLHGGDVELSSLDVADVARVMMENPVPGDRGYGAEIDLKLWG